MANPRLTALNWLIQVNEGRSVNELLAIKPENLNPQEIAQAKNILFGCLRYFHQLKTITESLMDKPLKAKDLDVLLSVIIGLYQLNYLSTPDHAAISESVELVKKRKKNWATGLVNGLLRRYQRESESIESGLEKSVQFNYSHPGWMVKKIKNDWPTESDNIFQQNNLKAPMTLRVNTQKITRSDYIQKLSELEFAAIPNSLATDGVDLNSPCDVFQLPGFTEGEVTVQDGAPQLAVELLSLEGAKEILDGCAAPGGKTGHIIQRAPEAQVTAVELSESRAEKISQTLDRLGLKCDLQVSDFLETDNWWKGQMFDRILLDVPCSASGVIRRNPDIKLHRKSTDLKALCEIQYQMLEKAWAMLADDGVIVYATCSIFKQENQDQIERFVQQLSESEDKYEFAQMPANIGQQLNTRASVGYQVLPGENNMDGFYLCGIKKLPKN